MGALLQFGVMLYKNLKLKWTSKKATCCEICFPVAFGSLLIAFYYMFLETHQEAFISNLPALDGFVGSNSKLMYSSANNTNANLVILKLQNLYGISSQNILGFASESDLEDYYQDEFLNSWAAIVFDHNFTLPTSVVAGNVNYTLRFPKGTVPNPGDTSANGNFDSNLYADAGFMTLQYALDTTITTLMLESANSSGSAYDFILQYGETPLPPASDEDVAKAVRDSLLKLVAAVWVTLALMATPFTLVGSLVLEKESKLREGMFMMGLPSWVYWGSWFIFGLIMSLPATSLVCGLLCWTALYNHATYSVVWVLFMLFSASLISLMFVVSTFINKSKFAGMVAFVIVMAMSVVSPAIEGASKINSAAKSVFSVFSPVALQLGNVVIVHFANEEYVKYFLDLTSHSGVTWENTDKTVRGLPSIQGIYGLLVFDTILYLFLAWYLNQVIPGEFGVARPWYFLFTFNYWKSEWLNQKSQTADDSPAAVEFDELNPSEQEPVSGLHPVVKIRHLRREFQTATGPYVAVANLNLELYEGQVLSLLGHNGAGKSTTISMMTALIPVTSGGAEVFGLNLNTELSKIRKLLGVCPQHDILWNELSVFDHLVIFSGLKGVPVLKMRSTINKLIQDLELSEKTYAAAGSLSGGQKRRLCVGIAFAAGSKLIFLDEPTSGLDPHSRRAIWELVKSNKEGRVIVLTSHFMDECEVLGDRIAILSHGKLRCVGSSLFLKSKFGVGYILSMAKKSGCTTDKVIEFVEQSLAGNDEDTTHVELLSDVAAELTLRLQRSDLPKFSKFFHSLEAAKDELLIDSYGISLTTLEEVFLKIAHEDEMSRHNQQDETHNNQVPQARKISEPSAETPLINGITVEGEGSYIWTQILVLLWKRYLITRREILFFLFQVGLPIACIIGAMIMNYFLGKLASDPTKNTQDLLQISMNMYSDSISDFNSTIPYGLANQNFSIDPLASYINYTLQYAGDKDGVNNYMKNSGPDLVGSYYFSNIDYGTNEFKAAALYSYLYSHSLPILTNILDQAIMQLVTNTTQTIVTNSHPLPGYLELLYSDLNRQALSSLVMAVGFCAAPAGFAVHVIKEREMRIKQLQQISGTSRIAYWLSFFIFDTLTSLIVVFATMITLYIGDSVYRDYMGSIFLLLFTYMISTIPLTYVLSFMFKKHHTSFGAIAGLYLFFAFCFIVGHISVLANTTPASVAITVTDYVFCSLSPVYCLIRGLYVIMDFLNARTYWDNQDGFLTKDHFLGMSLKILAIYFGFFLSLLFVIDSSFEIGSFFSKARNLVCRSSKVENEDLSELEDDDVAKEREVVRDIDTSQTQDNLVVIKHLRKAWDSEQKMVAVKDLCLHIKKDECFGLLGANGAGKTTTMSMLCGDLLPTRGTAFLNGYNIGYQLSAARSSIGFCPQFDALFGSMTGREHLIMYAKIRGIPSNMIKTTVNAFLSMLKLDEYADKYTQGYSGGNKRKLSFAIALLGNPTVVFLDEPSTGMDPFSKRFMWNVIASVTRGRSVILTTHSMEECDSLCSRIGIMNKGVMRCLGSSQHLKSKYGSGYTVEMKAASTDDLSAIGKFMEEAFPGSKVTESHGNMQKFAVPHQSLSLGKMFETIEAAKETLKLDDYSISQTTLEQIFLHISNS